MGSPEERKCAVAAFRYLTNCPDKDLARSCRIAFHELYMEDMWDLFALNSEAVARVKAEYEEVAPVSPSPHSTVSGMPGDVRSPIHL